MLNCDDIIQSNCTRGFRSKLIVLENLVEYFEGINEIFPDHYSKILEVLKTGLGLIMDYIGTHLAVKVGIDISGRTMQDVQWKQDLVRSCQVLGAQAMFQNEECYLSVHKDQSGYANVISNIYEEVAGVWVCGIFI
jgi:hypothetical protein